MTARPIDHRTASRVILGARVATGALAAVVAVFAVAAVPGSEDPIVPVIESEAPIAHPKDEHDGSEDEAPSVDYPSIAANLNMLPNAPKPPEVKPVVVTKPDQDEPPITPPAAGPLNAARYLGSLKDPRHTRALVVVDGKQRLIKVGDQVNGADLKLVEPGRCVFEFQGEELVLAKADRSETIAVAPVQASPLLPASMNPNSSVLNSISEDRQARLEEMRQRQREARDLQRSRIQEDQR